MEVLGPHGHTNLRRIHALIGEPNFGLTNQYDNFDLRGSNKANFKGKKGEQIGNGRTWVVGEEPKGKPTTGRNSGGVPLDGVHQIKLSRVFIRVEVSKPLSDHKEIESMKMKRMALRSESTRALQHHLHAGVERNHHRTCAIAHVRIVRRRSRIVIRRFRIRGKVRRVNSLGLSVEVRLKKRRRRKHERDVVHSGREFLAIGSLTRGVRRTRLRS